MSADSLARKIVEFHRDGLSARRFMDLTAEKYAIHLDGEGDGQWADLYDGQRIAIPPVFPGQIRRSENLLRPITDNAVAYHTTMPFRFVVEAKPDREARQRAMVDQALINHLSGQQRWNRSFAEAMYIAMVFGSCPVHAFWRDDITSDPYEPVYTGGDEQAIGKQQSIRRGIIDTFVGDPWDTVYNPGAKRNSRHRYTWGRTVPLSVVSQAFPGVELKGSSKLPSASRWQRTMRQWALSGLARHGSAAMGGKGREGEEMIALLCMETAPGIDPEYPGGRITLVAVQGAATVDRAEQTGSGQAVVLHDGPLPAGRFSSVLVYSANRFDDIHGKPFVGDLDDLQMQLNQGLSARSEYLRRTIRPPLVSQGIVQDTATWEDDAQMEVDPGAAFQPFYLQLKVDIAALNQDISENRQAMYTLGGYQAASRGEAQSGDAAAKVIALAKADDTIHGPTNQRFRETVEEYAGLAHALFRQYGDIPWLVEATGAEYAHLVDPWIDRGMVSQDDPSIKLTSGFGATIEAKANQLLQMVAAKGADGEPLLPTRQFRSVWPDSSTYPETEDITETRERRAKVINGRIRAHASDLEKQLGPQAAAPQMLLMMHTALMQEFPPQPDDDPMAHYNTLSSITQDEDESQTARQLARFRQAIYAQWLQGLGLLPPSPIPLADPMAAFGGQPPAPVQQGAPAQEQQSAPGPSGPTPQMDQGAAPGGTVTSESISPAPGEVQALTQEAGA